ncbi:hypothetical protein FA95DRAFT_1613042 [Auriscalpium vulgare]|uniref:Uncharacterized protein n=1 Tax=Auriscalpium vulgare TaxID=40419 RepID=A0ACB8R4W9_9AGAM|nr:hypothetical protein FA95DRAFT_1613042 [Auriscalpium vulgare]
MSASVAWAGSLSASCLPTILHYYERSARILGSRLPPEPTRRDPLFADHHPHTDHRGARFLRGSVRTTEPSAQGAYTRHPSEDMDQPSAQELA